jgi:small-conductance mechanosensitive channel
MNDPAITDLRVWGPAAAVAIGWVLLGLLVQRGVIPRLAKLASRSAWKVDDILIAAIRWPLVLWFALAGLRIAVRMLPLDRATDATLGAALLVAGILSVTWAVARFAADAVRLSASLSGSGRSVSLLASVARWTVIIVGVLVVAQTLGVRITPVITALGIGGLAVGLALQDTLANFFSGIRILAARQIRPGDFVVLESGQDGWVEDISWSQTVVRQPTNNIVLVPNARLAGAITTNYMLPSLPHNVVVQLGVAYGSDLDQVERVTVEVGRETQRAVPQAVAEWEPILRWKEFGSSSINCFLVLQAQSYPQRWDVVTDFIKRLHRRYRAEGIEIPFPIQTVVVRRETSAAEPGG